MLVWVIPPPRGDREGEAGDEEQEQDHCHHDDQHGVQVERGGQVSLVGALQLAGEHSVPALAGGGVEVVPGEAEVVVLADALASGAVPPVEAAVVAGHLLAGEAGQALAGAGICQELLSLTTYRGVEGTFTATRTTVMLQLYAGAVGGAVHVDNDRVTL